MTHRDKPESPEDDRYTPRDTEHELAEPTAAYTAPPSSVPPPTSLGEAFAARARRAVDSLAHDLSQDTLTQALSAPSDVDTLIEALLHAVSVEPTHPLGSARLRGVQAARRLLEEEGGTLSAEELGDLLGITRQAVNQRRQAGKLLALEVGRHGYAYPAWQLTETGTLPGLEATLRTLEGHDPWMQARFFLSPHPRLENRRPLDELRKSHTEAVLEAAHLYGEHGAH